MQKINIQLLNAAKICSKQFEKPTQFSHSSFNPMNSGLSGLEPAMGGGDVFHPLAVTPLSFTLCDPNFVQNYFGIRSIICDKKNQDQMIMTRHCKVSFAMTSTENY